MRREQAVKLISRRADWLRNARGDYRVEAGRAFNRPEAAPSSLRVIDSTAACSAGRVPGHGPYERQRGSNAG
jgi:hypothetical protein